MRNVMMKRIMLLLIVIIILLFVLGLWVLAVSNMEDKTPSRGVFVYQPLTSEMSSWRGKGN